MYFCYKHGKYCQLSQAQRCLWFQSKHEMKWLKNNGKKYEAIRKKKKVRITWLPTDSIISIKSQNLKKQWRMLSIDWCADKMRPHIGMSSNNKRKGNVARIKYLSWGIFFSTSPLQISNKIKKKIRKEVKKKERMSYILKINGKEI